MAIESGAASPALLNEAAQLGLLAQQPMGLAPPRRFNWMSLKLPGVPMDQGARWLAARTGWLFSAPAVAIWMVFVGLALATVAVHWQRLILDLPGLKQMATVEHAALLLAITVCTKVLHELGHAVSCRRLGARVGDLGFLLLCGTPCMYCDVSDAWILSRRRERAAVMMAGMYVEWVLAAIATFGWFMTGPGLFNTICLDVMLVCSVSTLVFNGNPLMRHDGYYIFGDLLNLPNLSVSASESYYRVVKQLLGRERAAGVDYLLTLYHLSSIVYRSMVNVLIGCWLGRMLTACHLLPAAIVAVTASGMNAVTPWWNGWRQWLRGQGPWNEIPRMQRWLVTACFFSCWSSVQPCRLRRVLPRKALWNRNKQ